MARVGLTTGQQLQQIFLDKGEVNPWLAYQELKGSQGFRGSYQYITKLFYVLRELGLIEFCREEESTTPIAKRYHKVVPGFEQDPRWHQPMLELYPSTGLGGLHYVRGSSQGRNKEYERAGVP